MSNPNSTYTSSSYTSYSSSSTSNGQTAGTRYAEQSRSDPSGTTVQSASQNLGGPVQTETRQYDGQGRQLVDTGSSGSDRMIGSGSRFEEIDDRDREAARLYQERIEEEYAKREGGA